MLILSMNGVGALAICASDGSEKGSAEGFSRRVWFWLENAFFFLMMMGIDAIGKWPSLLAGRPFMVRLDNVEIRASHGLVCGHLVKVTEGESKSWEHNPRE
jgi:hypothetical protein